MWADWVAALDSEAGLVETAAKVVEVLEVEVEKEAMEGGLGSEAAQAGMADSEADSEVVDLGSPGEPRRPAGTTWARCHRARSCRDTWTRVRSPPLFVHAARTDPSRCCLCKLRRKKCSSRSQLLKLQKTSPTGYTRKVRW